MRQTERGGVCQAGTVARFRAGGKGAALQRPERQTGRQDSPRAASAADGRAPNSSSSSAGLRVISPVRPEVGARSLGAGLDATQGSGPQDPGHGPQSQGPAPLGAELQAKEARRVDAERIKGRQRVYTNYQPPPSPPLQTPSGFLALVIRALPAGHTTPSGPADNRLRH